ncbi:bacteriochlorophyll 4-vinyl reductase [Paenibacillus sp. N1-5-1-14]|uniref:bacteriochlorophyll 4-vinyl reductase n=1 Tax=Paenibacillus radicibacter TaxID=2972488 RepID=UPI00215928E8|nr:bacteriochlorophyll 4-vinyl reductase [Paenibacillus radicibacter]MCR8645501.1 bacteriochlorophyll 4-vinyl reductase [Paenibacillus radicibacter]
MSKQGNTSSIETIIVTALKIPWVKVDRNAFLTEILSGSVNNDKLVLALEEGPVKAGISVQVLDKLAKGHIEKRTLQSAGISFAAGIPGGLAMAATIPADTLQFFGVVLKLAQELAYLFGYEDMLADEAVNTDKIKSELIIFLGVMFGVGGASSALRIVSSKLAQEALTKTIFYPIVKKIAAAVGIKITQKSFAQGLSKVIPIIGGVISGGMTYASMKPMGNRLRKEFLEVAHHYSDRDFTNDIANIKREIIHIELEANEEQANDIHDNGKNNK